MILHQPLSKAIKTTKSHLDKLQTLGVNSVKDLLLHFPRTYEDKRNFTSVSEINTNEINNIKGTLISIFHRKTKNGKLMSKGIFEDKTGKIDVLWFNQPYLQKILFPGTRLVLSGKAKYAFGKSTMQSPSFEVLKKDLTHSGRLVPVYHQTEGISSKWIREKLKPLINEWIKDLEEFLPSKILEDYTLMNYAEAVKEVHFPSEEKRLNRAKYRLSFEELFILQLKALQKKWMWQNIETHERKIIKQSENLSKLIENLPFTLTNAQIKTYENIKEDMQKPYPMSRLIQGDVGSGKTVVAGLAIINAINAGYQSAVMAPTEILARQHYNTLYKLFKPYSFNIQFIAGSTPEKIKKNIVTGLKTGTVDLVIGTHALIQETISFKNLGLAVIDEQHRFGVKQRSVLKSFGTPHLLSLSATPIPRTLAMTLYGDQDLSIIDEMPAGRLPIITRVVPENKRTDAYLWIENQIMKGRQAFVICPLVDESDVLEVKSAIQEYEYLNNAVFPNQTIGLLHGKMKSKEKDSIMEDFKQNKINILVSTSVIEVGIDVPNATIMLIEGADRFGLSQLHQFRGRVGRGEHQSYCFLFPKNQGEDSRKRLKSMAEFNSGFKLAEIDLEIRGPGEIYGLRQSGIPDLKMASLTDSDTISKAREAAQKIIDEDPHLDKYPRLKNKISSTDDVYIKD
ncbi:ATP-dependent DNA helicase RecG [Candidatus Peregrinibacteria bacterium]|nr:ATP-dependent DNA helicase RecG [Candidatus Peregrinibacteria bacterium]